MSTNSNEVIKVGTTERDEQSAQILIELKFADDKADTLRLTDSLALELCEKIRSKLPSRT